MKWLRYISPLSCWEVIKEGKFGRFGCGVETLCPDTFKSFHKRSFFSEGKAVLRSIIWGLIGRSPVVLDV